MDFWFSAEPMNPDMRQGLSTSPVKGNATMAMVGNNIPLVMIPMSQMITAESTDEC